jgi:hypothetical protein
MRKACYIAMVCCICCIVSVSSAGEVPARVQNVFPAAILNTYRSAVHIPAELPAPVLTVFSTGSSVQPVFSKVFSFDLNGARAQESTVYAVRTPCALNVLLIKRKYLSCIYPFFNFW